MNYRTVGVTVIIIGVIDLLLGLLNGGIFSLNYSTASVGANTFVNSGAVAIMIGVLIYIFKGRGGR